MFNPNRYPDAELPPQDDNIEVEPYVVHREYNVRTTSGQSLVLPFMEYKVKGRIYGQEYDEFAAKISFSLLDESQKDAVHKAAVLEHIRKEKYPNLNTFPHLRQVRFTESGLLYVCAPEEAVNLNSNNEPYAALRSAKILKVVDFATAVRGYYKFFKYDQADLEHFVPPSLMGANAHAFIDQPRVVTDHEGNFSLVIRSPRWHCLKLKQIWGIR